MGPISTFLKNKYTVPPPTLVSVYYLINLQDHAFAENPLEREYDEVEMKPEDVKSLQELYQLMRESGFEGLESKRIPVPEDRAPPEFCFDMMTGIMIP